MKRLLFVIFVILMIPIYLIISILKLAKYVGEHIIDYLIELLRPFVEGMTIITENMFTFWEKQIKKLERMNEHGNKN